MENAVPYQECSALLDDAAALRAAARERGYLFFRARLPAAAVGEVRRDVLQEIRRQGYLAPDTPLDAAVARPGTSLTAFDANPAYRAYYNGLLRLRSFHALALHPRLLQVLELLFEEPPLTHPRHICHAIFPNDPKVRAGTAPGLLRRARHHRHLDRMAAAGRLRPRARRRAWHRSRLAPQRAAGSRRLDHGGQAGVGCATGPGAR